MTRRTITQTARLAACLLLALAPAAALAQGRRDGGADADRQAAVPQFAHASLPVPCRPRQLADVTDGPRGLHRCKPDGSGWHSVLGAVVPWDFGAKGDGAALDTNALQQWLDAARTYKLEAYLPKGRWLTGTLQWFPRVPIRGAGHGFKSASATGDASVLVAAGAAPLLESLNPTAISATGTISDIIFEGNAAGTVGINVKGLERFKFERITVQNFTERGVSMQGSLMGSFEDSSFINNRVGVHLTSAQLQGYGMMRANFIKFENSYFHSNAAWAVDFSRGSRLEFASCDFELNGTKGVAESGVVRMTDWAPNGNGLGLVVNGGWSERNSGGYLFKVGAPASLFGRTVIKDFMDVLGQQAYGLYLESGPVSRYNLAHVQDSHLKGSAKADIATAGPHTSVRVTASTYDRKSIAPGSGFSAAGAVGDGNLATAQHFERTEAQGSRNTIFALPSGGGNSLHLGMNLDGSTGVFNRSNTSLPAWDAFFSMEGDEFGIRRAPAGPNPAAFTDLLKVDAPAAGETSLWLYDATTRKLQRVKLGAPGTGPNGTGRALYID